MHNVGKHQEHDVKVIKKAHSQIEGEFKSFLEKTKKFIRNLHDRKKEIADGINQTKNKSDSMKKSI